MRAARVVPTVARMSDPKTPPSDSCCGASCDPLTDAQRIEILCQQVEDYRRAEREAIGARDAALSRIGGLKSQLDDADLAIESMGQESGDAPMNTALRDVVRGQVLALLSAESREAVRCATNALGDALNKTAPPTKDDEGEESAEDILTGIIGNPVAQAVNQKASEYLFPTPPPTPKPNLTVTGPRGCLVIVTEGDRQIAYRVIGDSGVVRMVIPPFAMVVRVTPDPRKNETARMVVDFTEESHEIDAVMALDWAMKSRTEPVAPTEEPAPKPAPTAKKRAPKRKA